VGAGIQVCGHINAAVWEHYCNILIYMGHSMEENKSFVTDGEFLRVLCSPCFIAARFLIKPIILSESGLHFLAD
jgi:hypothetical protein